MCLLVARDQKWREHFYEEIFNIKFQVLEQKQKRLAVMVKAIIHKLHSKYAIKRKEI